MPGYKRIYHFTEQLDLPYKTPPIPIPPEVYQKLKEINGKKYGKYGKRLLIRNILKELNLNRYYEYIPHILNQTEETRLPAISSELRAKLIGRFEKVNDIYVKTVKEVSPLRKSFLPYNFLNYKLLQLELGKEKAEEYLILFPQLKSVEKTKEVDRIWEALTKTLEWEFIPNYTEPDRSLLEQEEWVVVNIVEEVLSEI